MKYSDEEAAGLFHVLAEIWDQKAQENRQLRAELAEAKQQRNQAYESTDNLRRLADYQETCLKRQAEEYHADIERKRARIAAEPNPFTPENLYWAGFEQCKRKMIAILDDKETPHA